MRAAEQGVRRPRLLVLASTFPAGRDDGTPAFVRDLAGSEAVDFDTVVLVPRVPGAPRQERGDRLTVCRFRYFPRRWEDLADGAIVENLRRRPSRWLQVLPFLLAEAWAVRRAVRRHRPDLLHVHWMLPQGLAALVGAPGLPRVVTAHGGDLYTLRGRLSVRVKRRVLRRADAVTAMNSDMAALLVGLGADPATVHVLPMGADVETVRAAAAGVDRVPGRIVFVGRLVEKKGVAVLLDALRRLPPGGWSLEVVGDGPLRAALVARAAGLPVTFRGALPRTEVAAAYARAEIAAVPSVSAASGDQDGLPVALLEAMSAGCAVVGSRIAGIDAAVEDGETGLLVPPGDAARLADAIAELLAGPERRVKLAAAARARSDEFSIEVVGRRYRELLHEVLERR
ncbi:MAG TPA: glycosyltransferase [Mycobacteriales bacterium]|nr:glycosyltransferase [Mycobacteriales bacterium]